jgi:hypothetical protein
MYVVAETLAAICGNPLGDAVKLIALRVISRPLTQTRLLLATTKRCSRPKKSARLKKFPRKVKLNCSAGKPAGPTAAPGGSCAALELLAFEELPFEELPFEELPELPLDEEGAGVEPVEVGLSCRLRKST